MEFNKIDYNNKFIKENYDRMNFTAPKGFKEKVEKRAKEKGFKSSGEYIKDLIQKDISGGGI